MTRFLVKPAALAQLRGGEDTRYLRGTVKFYQLPGGVLVEAEVSGLPKRDGFFGFHIHKGDRCTGRDFADTGGHYNPTDMPHPQHAGDLPPLLGGSGRAYLAVITDRFSIPEILGRTVVIHGHADDLTTQPAGSSGPRIACGVIRKA